jgi:hypothetical protein
MFNSYLILLKVFEGDLDSATKNSHDFTDVAGADCNLLTGKFYCIVLKDRQ